MPLMMVNVKEEADWDWEIGVRVDYEHEAASLKEESEWGHGPTECGVSAAAARAGLYAGHEVRGALVLGPTTLQPPDAAFATTGGRREARTEGPRFGAHCGEPPHLRACSVALDRIPPDRCGRADDQRDCQDSKQYNTRTNSQDLAAGEYSYNTCEEPFQLRACSVALERLPPDQDHCGRNTHTDTQDLAAQEYCCDTCGKQFKIKNTWIRHLQQHSVPSVPFGIISTNRLRSPQHQPVSGHHQTIHRSEISLTQFTQRIPIITLHQQPLIDTGETPHKCKFCIKRFRKKSALAIHQRIHTGEKPHKCQICTKQFSQRMSLDRHQLIHTGEKPHKCDICLKHFRHQSNLLLHQKLYTHIGRNLYKCKLCKKQYANRHHLVAHERVHSGERPYKCNTCRKRFSRRDHLVRHQFIHTGAKPYKCETCEKKFTREDHLDVHRMIHTGEKPYQCEICMKKFTQQVNLVTHLRVHSKKPVKKKYKR